MERIALIMMFGQNRCKRYVLSCLLGEWKRRMFEYLKTIVSYVPTSVIEKNGVGKKVMVVLFYISYAFHF